MEGVDARRIPPLTQPGGGAAEGVGCTSACLAWLFVQSPAWVATVQPSMLGARNSSQEGLGLIRCNRVDCRVTFRRGGDTFCGIGTSLGRGVPF